MKDPRLQLKPQFFFGYGMTKVTVWMDGGKCFPEASGKVSKKLDAACREMAGKPYDRETVQRNLLSLVVESNDSTTHRTGPECLQG